MFLITILLLALLALAVAIWSIKRHRDPYLCTGCDAPVSRLLPSITGLTHGTALKGNSVELLENGAFFDVMLADIRSATRSNRRCDPVAAPKGLYELDTRGEG